MPPTGAGSAREVAEQEVLAPVRAELQHYSGAQDALLRGAYHVLSLLAPHLDTPRRAHLQALTQAYEPALT